MTEIDPDVVERIKQLIIGNSRITHTELMKAAGVKNKDSLDLHIAEAARDEDYGTEIGDWLASRSPQHDSWGRSKLMRRTEKHRRLLH